LGGTQGSSQPAAYLNYLVFDKNLNYLFGGYTETVDNNQGVMQQFGIPDIPITQPGYIYVYLSNESSNTTKLILFDEMNVILTRPILQVADYYPFGMEMAENGYENVLETENRFLYNGKELQDDLDLEWYDYGMRFYDPQLGRFHTQDRFSEKYYDLSPYQYAANNPILFIDVNRDSLNVAQLRDYNADANDALVSDLQGKSGLTLTTDENGNVTYATDKKGRAVVSRDENGNKIGSRAARKSLTKIIDSETTISVGGTDGLTRTDMDGADPNLILFNPEQMQSAMDVTNMSSDLNPTTFGYALTFFHEVGHTAYGGAGQDPPFVAGQNPYETAGRQEILPNRIRRQLGSEYGQRVTYTSYYIPSAQKNYFPWSQKTLRQLKAGNVPTQKYIIQLPGH
jgi:RHS repeat-associated protein